MHWNALASSPEVSDPTDGSNAGNVWNFRIFTQSCVLRDGLSRSWSIIHVLYSSGDPCSPICTIPKTALKRGCPDEASQTKTKINCAHVKLINSKCHVKKTSLWPELGIMPCSMWLRFIWQFFNNIDQIKLVRKLESGNLPKYPPFEELLSNIREGVKFIPNLSTPHHRPRWGSTGGKGRDSQVGDIGQ